MSLHINIKWISLIAWQILSQVEGIWDEDEIISLDGMSLDDFLFKVLLNMSPSPIDVKSKINIIVKGKLWITAYKIYWSDCNIIIVL